MPVRSDPVYREYVRISKASFFVSLITVIACVLTAFVNWKQDVERKVLAKQISELRMLVVEIEGKQQNMQQFQRLP